MVLHLAALVTVLTVFLLFADALRVAGARRRTGVRAPATQGPPEFERVFRAQMNNLEAAVMFLPALWLFARYVNPFWAGVLGFVWIAARAWYAIAYSSGGRRGWPFGISTVITLAMALVAGIFVVRAMLLQS